MRYLPLVLLLALLPAPVCAQARPLVADADSVARKELIALEYHLADLLNRGDWQAYAPNVADDYRLMTAQGEVLTKQQVLAELRQRDARNAGRLVPDSLAVRIYGNTAVLTGVVTDLRSDGSVAARVRMLKTFVRRDGRWYLVVNQGTPLPPTP